MPISRRFFMKSGTMTALSAGLVFGPGLLAFGQKPGRETNALDPQIPSKARTDVLNYYTRETFEPYIGSNFQARGARGEKVNLTLTKVTAYKPQPKTRLTTGKARQTESFSLTFSASGPLPAFSNIPSLYHDVLGKLDLFLTSHVDEAGNLFYEAVINRLI